jgi:hypothetical protein
LLVYQWFAVSTNNGMAVAHNMPGRTGMHMTEADEPLFREKTAEAVLAVRDGKSMSFVGHSRE